MKFPLYSWQNECLEAWFENNCHGVVNVVTGAGKTILALAAIKQLKSRLSGPLRVKIVVPTTFLLSQWRNSFMESDEFSSLSRDEIGYYYGSRKDLPDRGYMLYVINSARYALARHIVSDLREGCSVLLIADECHHYSSGENKKIFDFLPLLPDMPGQYYSLGLSATPETFGYESTLLPSLGREIYRYGFSAAVKTSIISTFFVFQIALSFNASETPSYINLSDRISGILNRLVAVFPALKDLDGGRFFGMLNQLSHHYEASVSTLAKAALGLIYQRKTLICNASARIPCACRLIDALEPSSTIILFGERIKQADEIYTKLIKQYPGQVVRCHSQMGKQAQKNALGRYENGEARILVSCRSLDEGFNIPAANVGIILSSASVERQRIQRLGRILRKQEKKKISSLYYLYIENSAELPYFVSDMPKEAFFYNLSYDDINNSFTFPEYEEAAERVLYKFKQASPDKRIWEATEKCLNSGMLRPDWCLGSLLGENVWEEKICSAKNMAEKNYWVCMKEMGREIEAF